LRCADGADWLHHPGKFGGQSVQLLEGAERPDFLVQSIDGGFTGNEFVGDESILDDD